MSVQIDTETATLTGEQRLYRAMQEFVDPKTYRGMDPCRCLIGQVVLTLGLDLEDAYSLEEVADHFGVSIRAVDEVFGRAGTSPYSFNLEAAMQMAAEELGLAPTGKEERCRA